VFFIQRARALFVVDPMPSVASHHAPTTTPLVCKIIWNKKTQRSTMMIMCNLLFQGARASTCTHFKWVSHHKCKLEMQHYFLIVFVFRACALTLAALHVIFSGQTVDSHVMFLVTARHLFHQGGSALMT
jgi:hypothetical protein